MRSISIANAAGSLNLDGSEGLRAKIKVSGTGMAPVAVQWFEGAGNGASFRGGRVLPRQFNLPVKIYGDTYNSSAQVRDRMAKLAQIMSLANAPVRVTLDLAAETEEGDRWWADMVRIGGGEWSWESDTDGRSFIKTVFTLQAGDPYWTSETQQSKVISPEGTNLGLLGDGQSLAQLILATTSGLGATTITNGGDVEAYPVWTFEAPFLDFTAISQYGEVFSWSALKAGVTSPKATGKITVNTQTGEVLDENGVNRYKGMAVAPQFWSARPGETAASVTMAGAGAGTRITVVWNLRREVLF